MDREVIARALYDGRGGAFSLEGFYPDADAVLAALEASGRVIVPVWPAMIAAAKEQTA